MNQENSQNSYKIPYSSPDTFSKKKQGNNSVKIIIGVFCVLILAVGISLATGVWKPAWSPFGTSPERVLEEMFSKMQKVKTAHSEINIDWQAKLNKKEEFRLSTVFISDVDNTDLENLKSASDFEASVTVEGMQFFVNGKNRVIGETVYFQITTIPLSLQFSLMLMGIDVEQIREQWIRVDKETKEVGIPEEQMEIIEQIQERLKESIMAKELYFVKKVLPETKIKDIDVYHYLVALNKEGIKNLTYEIIEILGEELFSYYNASARGKEARVISNMLNMRNLGELMTIYNNNGYSDLSCNYLDDRLDIAKICENIVDLVGVEPVIFASEDEYCAYASLPIRGYFYCIDSTLKIGITTNPQEPGYCTGETFVCPALIKISEEDRQKAAKEEFLKDLNDFFEKIGDVEAELWIGKKDFYLYRVKFGKEIDMKIFNSKEEGRIILGIDMDFSKFNYPVTIEAPKEYKTIEEIYTPMFPSGTFDMSVPGDNPILEFPVEDPFTFKDLSSYFPASLLEILRR